MDNRKVEARLQVVDSLQFSGQANAGGRVYRGGHLDLSGQMNGPLVVDEGASAHISGQMNGDVEVHGELDVTGEVDGTLHVIAPGRATFATGACLRHHGRRQVVDEDGELRTPGREFYVVTDRTPRWVYQGDGRLRKAEG